MEVFKPEGLKHKLILPLPYTMALQVMLIAELKKPTLDLLLIGLVLYNHFNSID
jgi:hypothetical protein